MKRNKKKEEQQLMQSCFQKVFENAPHITLDELCESDTKISHTSVNVNNVDNQDNHIYFCNISNSENGNLSPDDIVNFKRLKEILRYIRTRF